MKVDLVEWVPKTPLEKALLERFQFIKTARNMKMNWSEWLEHIGVTMEEEQKLKTWTPEQENKLLPFLGD